MDDLHRLLNRCGNAIGSVFIGQLHFYRPTRLHPPSQTPGPLRAMEFGEIAAAASGLGGAGAILRAGLHFLSAGHKERMADKKAAFDKNRSNASEARKAFQAVIPSTGAFVHRMFAIGSFVILMAPIALPLLGDITVHYYWPREFNFFVIEFEKMKEITAGTGSKHIMILPIHISTCANVLSFYLTGKAFK